MHKNSIAFFKKNSTYFSFQGLLRLKGEKVSDYTLDMKNCHSKLNLVEDI